MGFRFEDDSRRPAPLAAPTLATWPFPAAGEFAPRDPDGPTTSSPERMYRRADFSLAYPAGKPFPVTELPELLTESDMWAEIRARAAVHEEEGTDSDEPSPEPTAETPRRLTPAPTVSPHYRTRRRTR